MPGTGTQTKFIFHIINHNITTRKCLPLINILLNTSTHLSAKHYVHIFGLLGHSAIKVTFVNISIILKHVIA